MAFLPNIGKAERHMLRFLGLEKLDDLFEDIPEEVRQRCCLDQVPEAVPEVVLWRYLNKLAAQNRAEPYRRFVGGGLYAHYVPAAVDFIAARTEFVTSYTPYQAEVSQGLLQALFEYQSLIAELFDMEVVNASLYDGATAVGEAIRMALRVSKRKKVIVPKLMPPHRRRVLQAYTTALDCKIVEIGYDNRGLLDLAELEQEVDDATAAVYVENPTCLGAFEEQIFEISDIAHKKGALLIAYVDPISLAIVEPPGAYDADIAVGEGQPLGLHLGFGGALLGIFACKRKYLMKMPGRLIGATVDVEGRRAFCMTLQTREQHIRRERATSNICTNESLSAITAAAYLALLGPQGLRRVCEAVLANTAYLARRLNTLPGVTAPAFEGVCYFREIPARFDGWLAREIREMCIKRGIDPGLDLGTWFEGFERILLACTTEVHQKEDLDRLVSVLAELVR